MEMLLSQGGCDTEPPTGRESYALTAQEAGSPESRCGQAWFLLEALRENLSQAPLLGAGVLGDPWCSLAVDGSLQTLPPLSYDFLCVSVCPSLPLLLSLDLGPTVPQDDFICKDRSPTKSQSEVQADMNFEGGTIYITMESDLEEIRTERGREDSQRYPSGTWGQPYLQPSPLSDFENDESIRTPFKAVWSWVSVL